MKNSLFFVTLLSFLFTSLNAQFTTSILPQFDLPPEEIRVADLDNDGLLDLIVSAHSLDLQFYKGNCDGTFGSPVPLENNINAGYISALIIEDLNHDDLLDLLIHTSGPDGAQWRYAFNEGSLYFSFQQLYKSGAVYGPRGTNVADFTGDGLVDILFSKSLVGELYLFKNLGNGEFSDAMFLWEEDQMSMTRMEIGDLDNDGDIDAVGLSSYGWAQVFMNDGTGAFEATVYFEEDPAYWPDIALTDADEDGDLDIVMVQVINDQVRWYENDGTAQFPNHHAFPFYLEMPGLVEFGDLNNDGHIDVIATDKYDDAIWWCENKGAGEYAFRQELFPDQYEIIRLLAADFDQDNDIDLIVNSEQNETVSLYQNQILNDSMGMVNMMVNSTSLLNCYGHTDGIIDIEINFCSDYSIAWENPMLSGFYVDMLGAGTYSFTVTDNNSGNALPETILIEQPSEISITIEEIMHETPGLGDGEIIISVEGGTGSGYSYEWYYEGNTLISNDLSPANLQSGNYQVVVIDENNCEVISEIITVEEILGLAEVSKELQPHINPNPSSGFLNIEQKRDALFTKVEIFNPSGKTLLEEAIEQQNFQINLSSFENGIYFLQFTSSEKIFTTRIVLLK